MNTFHQSVTLVNPITEIEKPDVPMTIHDETITFVDWLHRERVRLKRKGFCTAVVETAEFGSVFLVYSSRDVGYRIVLSSARVAQLTRGDTVEVRL
jgi:hypothetical protein